MSSFAPRKNAPSVNERRPMQPGIHPLLPETPLTRRAGTHAAPGGISSANELPKNIRRVGLLTCHVSYDSPDIRRWGNLPRLPYDGFLTCRFT